MIIIVPVPYGRLCFIFIIKSARLSCKQKNGERRFFSVSVVIDVWGGTTES